ncbi:hypothetical protein RchiOBHm_Chr2g0097901 [Rosa chinensis]|uniref:Uncharacterized protein n=1 Tax=Rosa chinensis TaxID=74649 RepID=A0A2P6RLI9_ROSCH|nr:hypothetical protein RchiOBHm_Chr2g0097901 [Rosa chinensis]
MLKRRWGGCVDWLWLRDESGSAGSMCAGGVVTRCAMETVTLMATSGGSDDVFGSWCWCFAGRQGYLSYCVATCAICDFGVRQHMISGYG